MVDTMTDRADHYAVAKTGSADWRSRLEVEMVTVAWAYDYISLPFQERLEMSSGYDTEGQDLLRLGAMDEQISNLSPFPDVALAGEKTNHDAFKRRLLKPCPNGKGPSANGLQ